MTTTTIIDQQASTAAPVSPAATMPTSLTKPTTDQDQWTVPAAALTDLLVSTFSTSSISTALYHAFHLVSRPAAGTTALTLDTLESGVIRPMPADKQAQIWLTAHVLVKYPAVIATARQSRNDARSARVRALPQDSVEMNQLATRLSPALQLVADHLSTTSAQPEPVMRFKSDLGYLGAHVPVYPSDIAQHGVRVFVHTGVDALGWGWDGVSGLGWKMHPVLVDGEVVFEIECAGAGVVGCEAERYLAAGEGWVGVTSKGEHLKAVTDDSMSPDMHFWRILPLPTDAGRVVIEHFASHTQGRKPSYLSAAAARKQKSRDVNSVYLELSADSPLAFAVEVVDG